MKSRFIILILLILPIFSCSDENIPHEREEIIEDNIKPPYTVKYEVTFSSSIVNYPAAISYSYEDTNGNWRIATSIGTTHFVSENELINGWTKEFTVTVDKNPLRISCSVAYNPKEDATVRTKMYVNGELVKDTTRPHSPSSSSTRSYYNDHYDVY